MYTFFWVIPQRLNFICRRFGTHYLFHLHRQVTVRGRFRLQKNASALWTAPCLSPPFLLASAIFESNLFLYKYPYCYFLQSHFIPPAYEDGTDRVFRNVGIYNSDAGELPKRKHNIVRTSVHYMDFFDVVV